MSGKDMCRALARQGWLLDRIHGAHYIYRHPDGRTVSVPVHGSRTLKRGTQRSVMRAADMI
jgi:predicted RNA binding protein YcfA (HicA-like mRNA interferase family)